MAPSKNKAQSTLDGLKGKKAKPDDSQQPPSADGTAASASCPTTPASELMTKQEQTAMLNRMGYQAGKGNTTFAEALRLYKTLGHGQKSQFYLQYKRDKTCKFVSSYTNSATSETKTTTDLVEGALNRYEIGALSKIPERLANYEALLDDLRDGLAVTKAHPKNALLNLYDYSEEMTKLKSVVDTNTGLRPTVRHFQEEPTRGAFCFCLRNMQ